MGSRGSAATPAKRLATGPADRGTPGANPTSPCRKCVSARAARGENERIGALESALEEAARTAHRQAAPFRIREEKQVIAPKRPGRKQGHPGAFRPKPDRIDEEITVELRVCPCCGGTQFKDQSEIERVIEEIPPIVPKITRLRTYQATCVCCSQEVRSSHPLQMSLATGAAGVQLGPHALAIAADLNKAKGLSMRKTCAVLADCFGLGSSAGGLGKNCSPKVGPPGDLYLDIPISPAMMPTTALHPVFYALQLGAYPFRS
jgi:transposase